LASKCSSTSDTASLLGDLPGVSVNGAGGVSSLPSIHGMADDRVRVKVDGMDLISACANHMNSPLSYIDPSNVDSIKVFAGITPVSAGGDSIAGTIQVDSAAPEFAEAGNGTLVKGEAGAFYRSNNQASGGNVSATLAGESVSMRYSGSSVKAKNYTAGGDFKPAATVTGTRGAGGSTYVAANEVGSSAYQSNNQSLVFGVRSDNHSLALNLSQQSIPYQGFPNQRMDMLGNDSQQANLKYTGQYDWGTLLARAYGEHTQHYMDFSDDKQFYYTNSATGMPMNTDGKNTGVVVKGDMNLSARDILRVGTEYQHYILNDWWSVSGTGGMSPNVFQNVNNGRRDRLAVFSEWEARWSSQWLSQLGLRSETVGMNADTVQGYKSTVTTYGAQAAAFNAADRQRTDNNIDVTALTRFTPDEQKTYELGFAQKTRSPNLYERYVWSATSPMVMGMNNWFGDGNGYVGNLNLKPEVARTLSGTASWHDAQANGFEVKVSPYYTLVENYIDAQRCPVVANSTACTAANLTRTSGVVYLQFVNQSAELYGADLSAKAPLGEGGYGKLSAKGVLNYVEGKNLTTGDHLYHIMPLNAKLGLEQRTGNWTNGVNVQLVADKTYVSATRNEVTTGSYGLLNLHSSYEWKQARLDLGIDNVLDKFYTDPMGGSYMGQGATMSGGSNVTPVPGVGRSINTSVTVKF
jgi:iron complex outermembrane receptor protein